MGSQGACSHHVCSEKINSDRQVGPGKQPQFLEKLFSSVGAALFFILFLVFMRITTAGLQPGPLSQEKEKNEKI